MPSTSSFSYCPSADLSPNDRLGKHIAQKTGQVQFFHRIQWLLEVSRELVADSKKACLTKDDYGNLVAYEICHACLR